MENISNNMKDKNQSQTGEPFDLMQKPEIDADHFFKIFDSSIQGLRQCKLISAAFELGVFEALKVPLSAGALAEKLGCDPVLMPHFCEALHSLGFLDRFEEGIDEEEEKMQAVEKDADENKDRRKSEAGFENQSPDDQIKTVGAVYLISELSATYLLKSSLFSQQHYFAERLKNVGSVSNLL